MSFKRFLRSVQQSLGFSWSFLIYYGIPFHHQALTRIYAHFVRPGDLCFDIGAHMGDRVRAFSKLGARVIALEPHSEMMSWLEYWYGRKPNITLLQQAVGARPGSATLWISHLTPSVSTISNEWQYVIQQNRRFAGVRWDKRVSVTVTTLDHLISQHGRPAFCKIDVEGAELEVLQGLSVTLPVLSFEYIPAMIETALGCINRLDYLGNYEYNWRVSEFPRWRSPVWLSSAEMRAVLARTPRDGNSGDVYARLKS